MRRFLAGLFKGHIKKDEGVNRRRFVRANLRYDYGQARHLVGAWIKWPGQNKLGEIYDISYQGMAGAKVVAVNVGESSDVEVILGDSVSMVCRVRVAWVHSTVIGLEILSTDVAFKQTLDEYLEDKIIGAYLRPIHPKYFAPNEDFQYWYHGPKDTNVFLWLDKEENAPVKRAVFELDGQFLLYEEGQIYSGSQLEEINLFNQAYYQELENYNKNANSREVVDRVVGILSQLAHKHPPLKGLIEELVEAKV